MFPSMLSWIMKRDVDRCLFSTWNASSDFYTFLRAAPGHYDYRIVVTVTQRPVLGTGSVERVRSRLRASVRRKEFIQKIQSHFVKIHFNSLFLQISII